MKFKKYFLYELLEGIVDNRGKNPRKYYSSGSFPVIDNILIKNTFYPNIRQATRFIDLETFNVFLRGYLHKDMPIMTLVGSGIGKVTLSPSDNAVIVQNTIGFKVNSKLDPIYLYYWFLTKQKELQSFNRGSGQPSIRKTDVENMTIFLPEIDIQNKIAKILSNIDKKIELNKKINDNLLSLIDDNYERYLNEIVDHEELMANDIYDFISGIEPGAANYSSKKLENYINFYRVGDMDNKCSTFIPKELAKEKIANTNDVLVSFDATIGRIAYGIYGAYSTGMRKIVVNKKFQNIIGSAFIYAYFNNRITQSIIKEHARGTTILHAGTAINHLKVKLDKTIIKEFNLLFENLFNKIKQIKKENDLLEDLKNILIPKLMNGEIDLDKIEI